MYLSKIERYLWAISDENGTYRHHSDTGHKGYDVMDDFPEFADIYSRIYKQLKYLCRHLLLSHFTIP